MSSEETELVLTPMDDMLARSRRRFGMNVWAGVGILSLAFVLFLLGEGPLKLLALALGIGLPVAVWRYTRHDPERLNLLALSVFLYGYYDPAKRATKGQRLLRWFQGS